MLYQTARETPRISIHQRSPTIGCQLELKNLPIRTHRGRSELQKKKRMEGSPKEKARRIRDETANGEEQVMRRYKKGGKTEELEGD